MTVRPTVGSAPHLPARHTVRHARLFVSPPPIIRAHHTFSLISLHRYHCSPQQPLGFHFNRALPLSNMYSAPCPHLV